MSDRSKERAKQPEPDEIFIRPACLAHDRILAQIDHAGWSPRTDPGELWSADRPFFGAPTGTTVQDVLVACRSESIVGYIKIRPELGAFGDWYIAGLAVAPAARRQGVARQLVRAALDRAARHDGHQVWLKVLSTNVPAVQLYSSLGFVELSRARGSFRQRPAADDLRLARSLRGVPTGFVG
ncbi:GNAT family N-acetyltransferase [Kocuria sp. KSNUG]|uniref:GNAT family N-acetyltransferase n=1 Tax=Kocuria sp. KSNUG TaxID=3136676 RepID=UPI003C2AF894